MMPATIKVGYRDYQVLDWPAAEANAVDCYGRFEQTEGVIRIQNLPEPLAAAILLHEVLHAAYDMGDLSAGDSEERVVSVLSKQIMQIIRDNPDLITYLNGANGNG